MGIEYYLVKPNQKEVFYLGKHFTCPHGITNKTYKDNANFIDYDCWEDFFWDFIKENSFYFEDITLEDTKEAIYRIYEWCLEDEIYFDHDCNDNREWTDWKETGSLSNIIEEIKLPKRKEEVNNIKASLKEFQSVVFNNPSYETALIGVTSDERAVYDFELMIEYLMKHDQMSYSEAQEFIELNTIRALPYYDKAPIVLVMNGRE